MKTFAKLSIILKEAGVGDGSVLIFEAPGDILNNDSENDYEDLTVMLQALVSNKGTLVVPTCTPIEGYPKPTFDPQLSPSEMGNFSEFFRHYPGVVRSHSTTHSLAALGSHVEEVIQGHRYAAGRSTPWGEGPFGVGSPWDWLYEHNAWWMLVNPSWRNSPSIIYIQALYSSKHSGITKITPFPRFDASLLVQELENQGLIQRFTWEENQLYLFRFRPMVDAALKILETVPDSLNPEADFSNWLDVVKRIRLEGHTMVGVAKTKITPPVPCLRWDGKEMTGIFRDLYARVIALSYRGKHAVLVLCDLEAISGQIVARIREQVNREIGIPAEAIMIAATHAHSTPDTTGAGFEDADYIARLVNVIAGAIRQACASQQPARIGWGCVPIRGLAHSRRMLLKDGKAYTTRYGVPSTWRVNPDNIASQGEIDPELTVLKIESINGEILACVSNFGCHATVALVSQNLSGDYPGEAMDTLEKVLGPQAVALCTIGTAADVDPTLEMPFWGPRNDHNARRLGRIFAAQVLEHLERIKVQELTEVEAAREQVTLELRKEWIDLLTVDRERMHQEFADGWTPSAVVKELLQNKKIYTEVQGFRLNDFFLIGLPGEVFVETGRRLKTTHPDLTVRVVELANENIGYIPTQRIWAEGGYEVGQHLWGRITLDGAGKLEAAACHIISELAM
jgi:aminoglycoside N3'-acetyltransferase